MYGTATPGPVVGSNQYPWPDPGVALQSSEGVVQVAPKLDRVREHRVRRVAERRPISMNGDRQRLLAAHVVFAARAAGVDLALPEGVPAVILATLLHGAGENFELAVADAVTMNTRGGLVSPQDHHGLFVLRVLNDVPLDFPGPRSPEVARIPSDAATR